MGKRIFEKWLGDKLYPVELDREELLRASPDLAADAGDVSASIGLVAELVGDYVRRYAQADAAYRNWKAATYLKFKLVDGKSPSDEIVKNQVEGEPEFLIRKDALAELEGDVEYLRGLFDALRAKASMIRARTDMARGKEDGEAVGFDTRATSTTGRAAPRTDDERAADVKDKLNKAKERL